MQKQDKNFCGIKQRKHCTVFVAYCYIVVIQRNAS